MQANLFSLAPIVTTENLKLRTLPCVTSSPASQYQCPAEALRIYLHNTACALAELEFEPGACLAVKAINYCTILKHV